MGVRGGLVRKIFPSGLVTSSAVFVTALSSRGNGLQGGISPGSVH